MVGVSSGKKHVATLIDFTLLVLAIALLVPSVVFGIECLVAMLPRQPAADPEFEARPALAILMPAHNEALGIEAVIRGLLPHLGRDDRLLVVADNCTDDTADRARQAGARVIERHDDAQRGKGFALAFGLDALAQDPPPVVVILDADCRVEPHALDRLAAMAQGSGRPVQAEYLLIPPADPSPIAVVSALAILVRNAVRPLGLHRMGLPCQLTGSGMAFPWSVLRSAAPTRGNIVEDLAMGIDLAMMGHPPLFCPEAAVRSDLPQRDEAATSQRRRWEHGQMATSAGLVPRLLFQGLLARRPDLVALGLDLLVPPLALLVMLVALALGVTTVSGFLSNAWLPAKLLLLATSLITLGVVGSWWKFGRHIVPARHLWSIPHYAAWKVPVYLDFLLKKRQRAWQRTERAPDEEEDSP